MTPYIRKLLPQILIVGLFAIVALLYFHPVLNGKVIYQSDIVQYIGMSKKQKDFKAATDEETYWTDAAFVGMPTYQLGAKYPNNYIKKLDLTLRFLPRPADYLFLYFISFYILLYAFKTPKLLAVFGALAFGFSTYLIIILGVGHNAKAHAIAYMPLVLSGVFWVLHRQNNLVGFFLTAIAVGLHLVANHFQMTYYLLLLICCLLAVYAFYYFKEKQLKHFFKSVLLLCAAAILGAGLNATNILATKEYAKTSTRGPSAITISPDGTTKENNSGLSYDYITEYSYGKLESLNLIIPNAMGGGSSDSFDKNSEVYKTLLKIGASPQQSQQILEQIPRYWGNQPIVAAPAYIGAIIVFLAVLGFFFIKRPLRYFILIGVLLSLLLSWGKNLPWLTNFFIEYIPLYDKFRAVSSIQVILELLLPLAAVLGLIAFLKNEVSVAQKLKVLKQVSIVFGGIFLLLLVFNKSILGFSGPFDSFWVENLGLPFLEALKKARASIFVSDAIRSIVLILIVVILLLLYLNQKIKVKPLIIALIAVALIDLIGVNLRYVNADDFVAARIMQTPFTENELDAFIRKDTTHFRVFDATTRPFSSARASYFYNSIGGYHAAKPGRLQDIYDFYLEGVPNPKILKMLNAKYKIKLDEAGYAGLEIDSTTYGNAWIVDSLTVVNTTNEALLALETTELSNKAIITEAFKEIATKMPVIKDSLASVKLVNYKMDRLEYAFNSTQNQYVIFSEMYYEYGWQAYIDGEAVPHYRANYMLRGLTVPAGKHTIVFEFKPQVIQTGSRITLASFFILIVLFIGFSAKTIKEQFSL